MKLFAKLEMEPGIDPMADSVSAHLRKLNYSYEATYAKYIRFILEKTMIESSSPETLQKISSGVLSEIRS